MPTITVRNLSESTHRALKIRAAKNGRSVAAEIRQILDDAVSEKSTMGLGSQLAALGRRFGGIELNYERDRRPIEPAKFD